MESPSTSECTFVGIFKGLGLTVYETAKPGFCCKWASGTRFSTGEADLNAYRGVHTPHVRDFFLPQGMRESPRTTDRTMVSISNELGFTECEATKPGFGGNGLRE